MSFPDIFSSYLLFIFHTKKTLVYRLNIFFSKCKIIIIFTCFFRKKKIKKKLNQNNCFSSAASYRFFMITLSYFIMFWKNNENHIKQNYWIKKNSKKKNILANICFVKNHKISPRRLLSVVKIISSKLKKEKFF